MPYKSNAQRRAMNAKAASGEISQSVVDEFNEASKGKQLPERVKPKKKSKDGGLATWAKARGG
jgi:hypothetical protein